MDGSNIDDLGKSFPNKEVLRSFVASPAYDFMIRWAKEKKDLTVDILLNTEGDSEAHALRGQALAMCYLSNLLAAMKSMAFATPKTPEQIASEVPIPEDTTYKRPKEMLVPVDLGTFNIDILDIKKTNGGK
jgi:hypothetical protein